MENNWKLDTLTVTGGFLDQLKLDFPEGLTCVIGPRGSGKSTLAETLRYGLGTLKKVSKQNQNLIKANLASTTLTLKTKRLNSDSSFEIKCPFGDDAIISSGNGEKISFVNLERGTFLPFDGYNSNELEEIANETFGEKRRALIDDLCQSELDAENQQLSELKRKLSANADALRSVAREIDDLGEKIDELSDARGKLQLLPDIKEPEFNREVHHIV